MIQLYNINSYIHLPEFYLNHPFIFKIKIFIISLEIFIKIINYHIWVISMNCIGFNYLFKCKESHIHNLGNYWIIHGIFIKSFFTFFQSILKLCIFKLLHKLLFLFLFALFHYFS